MRSTLLGVNKKVAYRVKVLKLEAAERRMCILKRLKGFLSCKVVK